MNPDKKKSSSSESTPKSSQSKSMKSSKSSSKSRVKTPKPDSSRSSSNVQTPTSSTSLPTETPSTPTSSIDPTREKSHQKGYAGFGPRTIKIIWEQHDTSDTDLKPDLLPVMAEDVSYKMWELVKNIKTYSMHSGGAVTSDLVNEVLKDCDCPPVLGSMDTEWDRIDYDGSFFFNSDKVIELRNEYQKDVQITMPMAPPFVSMWPLQVPCRDLVHSFLQSIFLITLGGSEPDFDTVRQYVYSAPFIGGCYKVLLMKIIQTLAFKQTNHVKLRCWRLMQTLVQHPSSKNIYCREEYFHLAEIFICQLLGPYDLATTVVKDEIFAENEDVKSSPMDVDQSTPQAEETGIQVKLEDIKDEKEEKLKLVEPADVKEEFISNEEESSQPDHVYSLDKDDEDNENIADQMEGIEFSPYSAEIVDLKLVDDLCETMGLIGAISEFFNTECMHLILKRLERLFDQRKTFATDDYEVISRAIRGLFALGEYAFREFIPFMEKMEIIDADIPDSLCSEFARCAIFLRGHDDIFLYEWLRELCSPYRLVPFMTYYAQYHQKLIRHRYQKRRVASFKIIPKVSAKRLSIPPSKSHKKDRVSIEELFPDREIPVKSHGPIRLKYSGCRQIPIKIKSNHRLTSNVSETNGAKVTDSPGDIIIARRKLFKPLTDEQRSVHLSTYHPLRL